MNSFQFGSLGEAWVHLVGQVLQNGECMGDEGLEVLRLQFICPAAINGDPIIARFGNPHLIAEMEKVFFGSGPNALGHSYAGLMRGPFGQAGLDGVISLLRSEPQTKRALLTLVPTGTGKVPCVNVIQFLVREQSLQTIYFARAQDVFKKLYADALCVARMAQLVADGMNLSAGSLTGFIGSGHIYDADLSASRKLLAEAPRLTAAACGKEGG